MASAFSFLFTDFFSRQWKKYSKKSKTLIQDKLRLVKENPFRFERLEGYKFVFKVKISVENKYSRLMYAVFLPDSKHITILGIFDRKVNYKDFEKMFKELKRG